MDPPIADFNDIAATWRQLPVSQNNALIAVGDINDFENNPPFAVIRNAKRSYLGNVGERLYDLAGFVQDLCNLITFRQLGRTDE